MTHHAEKQGAIVVHEDALDAACQAASRSIDQLIWQGKAEVAKSVTLFGPGIVVLPLFGRVSGVDEKTCLAYAAHPKRTAKGGVMDRIDFESKFGQLEPGRLVDELMGGRHGLERRLRAMSDEELHNEVVALQDWREKANGRLKTLEKRAAWAFLGMPAGSANRAAVKRAFKRRALELHPDKGGDAERFQLLQEMKELLILPTAKELEEQERDSKEREAEVERARESEQGKAKDATDMEAGDSDDLGSFSSDSGYDVDEEFKKMFPKKRKKKKGEANQGEAADGDLDLAKGENFNRPRHEAARRKLHRNFVDMWERAGKLAQEIQRAESEGGGDDALRQLRKFIDRFASLEVSKLQEDDPRKAQRIFRRFLEQGSEVMCAAGAIDPVATVSSVAMQVNYPLLSIAPSEDLQARCSALLEAIQALPSMFERFIMPAEDVAIGRRRAAEPVAGARGGVPIRLMLLVPDAVLTSQGAAGLELPGTIEREVEFLPGSTLSDLRAAALHMCGGSASHDVIRLFSAGCFISGRDATPLAHVEMLKKGLPVQCLPSNRLLRPRDHAKAAAVAAYEVPASSFPSRDEETAHAGKLQACPFARNGAAALADPLADRLPPITGKVEAKSAAAPLHKPSPQLLSALGVRDGKEKAKAEAPDADINAARPRVQGEVDRKTEEDDRERKATTRSVEEERHGEEEGDPWFESFFSNTKRLAEAKAEEEVRRQEERRRTAERLQEETELHSEEQEREERAQRRAVQEQGKHAMEARLQAQRRAAEAKKQVERERKAVASAQQSPGTPDQTRRSTAVQAKRHAVPPDAIVRAKEDPLVQTLQRRRTTWDANWAHPCAGDRKGDGSAIFCYPCDGWINVGDPFDHGGFELHCEKVGHYGWID